MRRFKRNVSTTAHPIKSLRALLVSVGISLSLLLPIAVGAGGQDQVRTTWPYGPMTTAGSYGVYIVPESVNSNIGTYVTGWLGLDFDSCVCATFTQVGIVAQGGVHGADWHWFVYSYAPVTCLRGTPQGDGFTCNGDYEDLVDHNKVSSVSIYRGYTSIYGPSWAALVNGPTATGQIEAHEVAYINVSSTQIYKAQVTSEESFNTRDDPGIDLSFYFYHPAYASGGSFVGFPSPGGIDTPSPVIQDHRLRIPVVRSRMGVFTPTWAATPVTGMPVHAVSLAQEISRR